METTGSSDNETMLGTLFDQGRPEVFNTDQGSQFTSEGFTGLLE